MRHVCSVSLFALCAALLPSPPSGPAALAAQEIRTPEVDLLARTIVQEVEVLRWHMGRPLETRSPIPVDGVAIRENFRQAMTLWSKVNQLGIELVGGGESPPAIRLPRSADYGPEHVHAVLTSAAERLAEIREGVGIVGAVGEMASAEESTLDPSATPSHVFQSILQSNRQLNRMLEQAVQPGDVFQQVQQSVFYASEILTVVGDDTPFPAVPTYDPGLMPAHVYGRLLAVFDRLAEAFETLDLEMVDWRGGAYDVDESLTPSDVFDLATLLLSELEYLHAQVPDARAPLQAPHPGRRWPSDVYQQAGVLAEQAARIMTLAREKPELFRNGGC